MSGAASLGLRTGSCGSLPAAGAGAAVPCGRKARGWGLRAGGDKERLQLLHRALRLVGRRGAGLLLLLAVASAALFCSLFAVVKGNPPTSAAAAFPLSGPGRTGMFSSLSRSRSWRLRNSD